MAIIAGKQAQESRQETVAAGSKGEKAEKVTSRGILATQYHIQESRQETVTTDSRQETMTIAADSRQTQRGRSQTGYSLPWIIRLLDFLTGQGAIAKRLDGRGFLLDGLG